VWAAGEADGPRLAKCVAGDGRQVYPNRPTPQCETAALEDPTRFRGYCLLGAKLSCLVAVNVRFRDQPASGAVAEMVKGVGCRPSQAGREARGRRTETFTMAVGQHLAVGTRSLGIPTAARRAIGTVGICDATRSAGYWASSSANHRSIYSANYPPRMPLAHPEPSQDAMTLYVRGRRRANPAVVIRGSDRR
jgi:hypothetical protein